MKSPKIIAEIGCNHKGDMAIAKEMIMTAATYCKVDVVKFQKRCNKELLTPEEYNAPHPHPENSYGKTYGEHREFLEFNLDQHRQLQEWCKEFGVEYSTSVWDITSAKEICTLHPNLIKVPSACNLNKGLLEYLCDNFGGEIHLSFGMTTRDEEEQIIQFFESKSRNKDLVIYDCTSGYPVPFEDICLLEITRLRELYADRVKAIGFSGHHLGIAVDSAAVALGAEWIERHYTLDRTWKGTDHAASLEPDGVRKLARDCRAVAKALTYKKEDILDIEKVQRNKLKKKSSEMVIKKPCVMKVTKFTIKADKVFMLSCDCEEFTASAESGFKTWIMDYLEKQYPDKGVTIFTRYEHPVISAIAVIDINEGQEGDIEEINTKM
jgi:N-acetylneuraminate synthase (EC 2.5.1.56)